MSSWKKGIYPDTLSVDNNNEQNEQKHLEISQQMKQLAEENRNLKKVIKSLLSPVIRLYYNYIIYNNNNIFINFIYLS
jgi:hypothetical protein